MLICNEHGRVTSFSSQCPFCYRNRIKGYQSQLDNNIANRIRPIAAANYQGQRNRDVIRLPEIRGNRVRDRNRNLLQNPQTREPPQNLQRNRSRNRNRKW